MKDRRSRRPRSVIFAALVGVVLGATVVTARAADHPPDPSADVITAGWGPLVAVTAATAARDLPVLAGSRSSTRRVDKGDIPPVPDPTPEWEVARSRLVSAPWDRSVDDRSKVVYLTFDDGPYPQWTPRILALLALYDAKATFFQLGLTRREFPDLTAQVEAAGHRIANHTFDHPDLTRLSTDQIRSQLRGGPESTCFRPPYGATNQRVEGVVESEGMRSVLWDVDTQDWRRPGATSIASTVLREVVPGAIVLMHDGGGERDQTVIALARVLPELTARGYEFHALPC